MSEFLIGQTCFVVKYALTTGITKEVVSDNSEEFVYIKSDKYRCYKKDISIFLTFDEALIQADKMRVAKIKSHQKSIAKLAKLDFKAKYNHASL